MKLGLQDTLLLLCIIFPGLLFGLAFGAPEISHKGRAILTIVLVLVAVVVSLLQR